jgi:hypothetical protein
MKILRRSIPFALSVLAAGAAQVALATPPTPPITGAYVTDAQNTWVQDRVGDRIGTVNMIMCIIGSMRGDAMVNHGPYIALIDQGKCQGRGDSSKSTSTSAGASNATNYMSSVVVSTQASENDPLIMKAWLHDEQDNGGSPEKVTIYAYVVATAGKSSTYPNGLFSMYFCGEADSAPGACIFTGSLKSSAAGLQFYEDESNGGGSVTSLILQNDPTHDSGIGKISGTDNGTPYNYKFAFDSANFRRQEDSNPDVCFDRLQANGESSTWRYGTYNSDGSRVDVSNPGFSVKYVNGADTYYGFWSFWGLWLPDSAMAGIAASQGSLTRHVGSSDVTITPIQKGGKLWKLTRQSGTLDDYKNISMMYWSHASIGTTNGSTPAPQDTQYELQWDGSHLNAIGYQVCDQNGCAPHPLNAPVALNAATLSGTDHVRALPVFFPAGGGNGSVDVPTGHAFQGADTVSSRTREVVSPSTADFGLNCVTMCPKTGTNLVSSANLNNAPFKDSGVWGPSATNYTYTFHAGMINDGSADADASGASKSGMGSNQWGLTSGTMVADADLNSIRCDSNGTPNTGGSNYCSALIEQANVIYQWETGPNQWNKYFGANGITIDPPKLLTLNAVHTPSNTGGLNNIKGAQADNYDGNKVQLQYSAFGELQGIPGSCVDPDTNVPAQCGPSTRWVPAFDMLDGTAVTDSTPTNYFVKYLERELRLGTVDCNTVSGSLSLSSPAMTGLSLPGPNLVDVQPKVVLGAEATPASAKPSVIDGIVQ